MAEVLKIKGCEKFDYDILVRDYGFERIDDALCDYKIYQKSNEGSSIHIDDYGDIYVSVEITSGMLGDESGLVDQEILCTLYDLIQAGIIVKEVENEGNRI